MGTNKKITFFVSIVALLYFFLKLLTIDSVSYTKNNWFYDRFFSTELIRNAPLISQSYYISYSAHDGNKPETNVIFFTGTTDKSELESYLRAKKFTPEQIDINTIRWISPAYSGYDIYLSVYPDKKEVIMAAISLD